MPSLPGPQQLPPWAEQWLRLDSGLTIQQPGPPCPILPCLLSSLKAPPDCGHVLPNCKEQNQQRFKGGKTSKEASTWGGNPNCKYSLKAKHS